jgi:hypothetical protein
MRAAVEVLLVPVAVVMLDGDPKDLLEVAAADDQPVWRCG